MNRQEIQMEKRRTAVEQVVAQMVNWYIRCNGGKGPKELVEMRKDDCMLRWCDPPLPGLDNPVLIEFIDRGFWALKTDKLGRIS